MKGKKKSVKKLKRVLLIVAVISLLLPFVLAIPRLMKYNKIQQATVELISATASDIDINADYDTKLRKVRSKFDSTMYCMMVGNNSDKCKDYRSNITTIEKSTKKILNELYGYELDIDIGYYPSDYLEEKNLFDLVLTGNVFSYVLFIASETVMLVSVVLLIRANKESKEQIEATNDSVIITKSNKKTSTILIKDIQSVESISRNGIFLKGAAFKEKIHLIENNEEIKNYILEKMSDIASSITPSNVSNADELKKFKQLLDEGLISQEEYDLKKKELLNL